MSAVKLSLFLIHRETGQRYPIRADVVIGRIRGDLVFFKDTKLSPEHCRIIPTAKGVAVRDLRSEDGTRINGNLISPDRAYLLSPGGELSVGEQVFQLQEVSVSSRVKLKGRKREKLNPSFFSLYALILCNLLLFAWSMLHGLHWLNPSPEQMSTAGGAVNDLTTGGQWWRLITALFLHYGLIHLLCNVWALFTLSEMVIFAVGDASFFLLYMFTGVVGMLINLKFGSGSAVAAGSSCAVAGIVGALLALRLIGRVKLYRIGLSGTMALLACVAQNYFFAKSQLLPVAHLGAAIAGFFTLIAIDLSESETNFFKQLQLGLGMTALTALAIMYIPHKTNSGQLTSVQAARTELGEIFANYVNILDARDQQTATPRQTVQRIQNILLPRLNTFAVRLASVPVENEDQRRALELEKRFVATFIGHANSKTLLEESGDSKYVDGVDQWNDQFEQIRADLEQQRELHFALPNLPMVIRSPFQIVEREMRKVLRDYRALGKAVQEHQVNERQMAETIRHDLIPKLIAVETRMGVIVPQGEVEKRRLRLQRKLISAYVGQVKSIVALADTQDQKYNKDVEKWSGEIERLANEIKPPSLRKPAGR